MTECLCKCDADLSFFFFFKQKTAYDMVGSDWSSDVCSSDLYSADFAGETMGTAITIASRINGEAVTSTPPTLRVVGFTRIVAAGATMVGAPTTIGGFTCGIITTGAMYCWGISWLGIRGNSDGGSTQPGLVPTLVGGGHQWSDVAAGNYFVCAVAVGGGVYCWGDGDVGQLGNGLSGNP